MSFFVGLVVDVGMSGSRDNDKLFSDQQTCQKPWPAQHKISVLSPTFPDKVVYTICHTANIQ